MTALGNGSIVSPSEGSAVEDDEQLDQQRGAAHERDVGPRRPHDAPRLPDSRMRASSSASASPSTKLIAVSGSVPRTSPSSSGRRLLRTSVQDPSSTRVHGPGGYGRPAQLADVLAEVLLGDAGERAVRAQRGERVVDSPGSSPLVLSAAPSACSLFSVDLGGDLHVLVAAALLGSSSTARLSLIVTSTRPCFSSVTAWAKPSTASTCGAGARAISAQLLVADCAVFLPLTSASDVDAACRRRG